MLLLIGNNKKSILKNRVLIYIPNSKIPNEYAVISCVLSQDKNGGKPSHDRYKMLNTMIKLLGFFCLNF